jgi:hypothetical protein
MFRDYSKATDIDALLFFVVAPTGRYIRTLDWHEIKSELEKTPYKETAQLR